MEDEEREGWEPRIETCRIVVWRGYRTSSFYARPDGDGPGRSIGAPSTSFRLRGSAVPDGPEARLAHQELVARLQANGWVETGGGDHWHEKEFARTVFVPYSRAELAEDSESAVSEDEPGQHRALPTARAEPAPSSLPEPVALVRKPAARRQLDRWRLAAAAGLAAAIAAAGWLATHPSSLRAASSSCLYGRQACVCGFVDPVSLPRLIETGPTDERPCVH